MKSRKTNTGNHCAFLAMGMVFTMAISSCGEKKENTPVNEQEKIQNTDLAANIEFSDGMTEKLFDSYQELRAALVASDVKKVQAAAKTMTEVLSDREELRQTAQAMADTEDIENQRELFSELTAMAEPVFREALSDGTIYKQFCPMAFDGEGGYWISTEEAILNPYYGDKMLKCGKVVDEIN